MGLAVALEDAWIGNQRLYMVVFPTVSRFFNIYSGVPTALGQPGDGSASRDPSIEPQVSRGVIRLPEPGRPVINYSFALELRIILNRLETFPMFAVVTQCPLL